MSSSTTANLMQAISIAIDALTPFTPPEQRFALQTISLRFNAGAIGTGGMPVISPGADQTSIPVRTRHEQSRAASSGGQSSGSEKDYLRDKSPTTDIQRVAVLAHLLHQAGQDSFKASHLAALNTKLGGPRINSMPTAANNAMKFGYVIPAGSGAKKLSALGEKVVGALPDQAAVRALKNGSRPRSSRKKPKATKTS